MATTRRIEKRSPAALEHRRVKARARGKLWYLANRERKLKKNREWQRTHRDRMNELARIYYWRDRDKHLARCRKNYRENRENRIAAVVAWKKENKDWVRAYKKDWYRLNPEKVKAARKRAYLRRGVAIRAAAKRYRQLHYDKVYQGIRQWKLKNPLVRNYYEQTRRAKKLKASGSCTAAQWLERINYYQWCCRYCKKQLTTKSITQDHAIPLSRGGSQWPANLVPACRSCNSQKHDKTLMEFLGVPLGYN